MMQIEKSVDLSYRADHGVFKAWNDKSFFDAVRISESGAIAWGDDIELCPDALYVRVSGKN